MGEGQTQGQGGGCCSSQGTERAGTKKGVFRIMCRGCGGNIMAGRGCDGGI